MSKRTEFAARSWAHLQQAREIVRSNLTTQIDDQALIDAVPAVAAAARSAAVDLPNRLIDGNLGAALAGHVVGHQHEHPDIDSKSLLGSVLEAAGGHTATLTEVCEVPTGEGTVVYYRRRNCCLRDRVTDRHRCDTCSLRPHHELDGIVKRAIASRSPEANR